MVNPAVGSDRAVPSFGGEMTMSEPGVINIPGS